MHEYKHNDLIIK